MLNEKNSRTNEGLSNSVFSNDLDQTKENFLDLTFESLRVKELDELIQDKTKRKFLDLKGKIQSRAPSIGEILSGQNIENLNRGKLPQEAYTSTKPSSDFESLLKKLKIKRKIKKTIKRNPKVEKKIIKIKGVVRNSFAKEKKINLKMKRIAKEAMQKVNIKKKAIITLRKRIKPLRTSHIQISKQTRIKPAKSILRANTTSINRQKIHIPKQKSVIPINRVFKNHVKPKTTRIIMISKPAVAKPKLISTLRKKLLKTGTILKGRIDKPTILDKATLINRTRPLVTQRTSSILKKVLSLKNNLGTGMIHRRT